MGLFAFAGEGVERGECGHRQGCVRVRVVRHVVLEQRVGQGQSQDHHGRRCDCRHPGDGVRQVCPSARDRPQPMERTAKQKERRRQTQEGKGI